MYNTHTVYASTVVFSYTHREVSVILERTDESPDSLWRVPTAPVPSSHTSLSALENHLYTVTGIKTSEITYQEQLYTTEFRVDQTSSICISYIHISRETTWHKGRGHVGLFPLSSLPKLSPLDKDTIAYGIERLKAKAVYTNILALLLPSYFSLAAFQDAYETIAEKTVDRRNFRKKVIGLNFLTAQKQTGKASKNTPQLYASKDTSLRVLERPL